MFKFFCGKFGTCHLEKKRGIVLPFSGNLHVGAMKLKLGEDKSGMEILSSPEINTSKLHVNKLSHMATMHFLIQSSILTSSLKAT